MTDTQVVEDMAKIRRRVETIEATILRILDLMEMMVIDQRKAQTLLSAPDERHDFVPKSERKMP